MTPETLKVNWNHTFKRSSRDNQRIDRIEKDKPKKGFAVRKCPECKQAWEKLNILGFTLWAVMYWSTCRLIALI